MVRRGGIRSTADIRRPPRRLSRSLQRVCYGVMLRSMDLPPPPPPSARPPIPGSPPTNQKAVWSLILAILGIMPFTFIASVAALILGFQARSEIARAGGGQGGQGLAIAGIILGFLPFVGVLLLFIASGLSQTAVIQSTLSRMS